MHGPLTDAPDLELGNPSAALALIHYRLSLSPGDSPIPPGLATLA